MGTSLSSSWTETIKVVQPDDTNALNTAHGGTVVKWMDETGGIAATRFSREVCVTVSMRRVDFHNPLYLGNAAPVEAYVYRTGDTSVDVCIKVFSENLFESERTLTTESFFRYVAIDGDRNTTEVPELEVETEEERRLRDEALDGGGFA